MGLLDILQQATTGAFANPEQHFDQVAQHATPDLLSQGLAAAFRSDQTPAFGQMVGQIFGQASGSQQAGMLNALIAAVGPAALSAVAGGALGRVLPAGATQLTPQQASQLTPQQVQEIAAHAETRQPGVIDQLSSFYADHPTLVKTIGGAALAIALSKMKDALTR
jgi:hypothetical protein